jgi:hypothetical protein
VVGRGLGRWDFDGVGDADGDSLGELEKVVATYGGGDAWRWWWVRL